MTIDYLTTLYYGTFMPPDVPKRSHRVLDDTKKPVTVKRQRSEVPAEVRNEQIKKVMRLGKFMAVYEIAEKADATDAQVRSVIQKMDKEKMVLREMQKVGSDQRYVLYRLKKEKK